ncbi:hypothetical protein [Paenibacillus contaminans]|uniref:Uncharacterized protein n=1 Tax=Paenibacillus contaminans TaxID=450362 RepID=A0A329MNH6_9BACL|nr:hypothetical protein [Paenibacillus contaminans]RAV21449.1 hypothetical protein DQG23_09210 [Paenibacillus contaminans]
MNTAELPREHPVLSFAGEEWYRLLDKSKKLTGFEPDPAPEQVWIGTWGDLENRKPGLLKAALNGEGRHSDDFVIIETEDEWMLSGRSERATLYAVYQYAQEQWGFHWIYPVQEPTIAKAGSFQEKYTPGTPGTGLKRYRHYSPRMERRGFVFETINEPDYLKSMIDWFGKNKINELFFTFSLWDQVGGEIAPEIAKRGISVTLGGHSLMFFLKKGMDRYPNLIPDHPYTAKAQVNFRDPGLQELLLNDIAAYCRNVPNLTRVSLWPEDIAAKEESGFLESYLQFTEKLDTCFHQAGLTVQVEHIAYNAGLSWSMLERNDTEASRIADTLLAYWGRDYRHGYDDSPRDTDGRAKQALLDWNNAVRKTGRKLTIFEYYSDHFMLSQLFAFLPNRIAADIAFYEKLQVHGIVNLVVPYRGADPYPWKWVHSFNSYVFCRALWSDDIEGIARDYYAYYPEGEREAVRFLFKELESKLGQITYWNTPLFPARVVDPEKANATEERKAQIVAMLTDLQESIRKLMQQLRLTPGSEPQRFGQHIVEMADTLSGKWADRKL